MGPPRGFSGRDERSRDTRERVEPAARSSSRKPTYVYLYVLVGESPPPDVDLLLQDDCEVRRRQEEEEERRDAPRNSPR